MGCVNTEDGTGFEELCTIIEVIAERYGIERVHLFDSRARGENTAEND